MILRLLPILGITFIDIFGFSMLLPLLPFFVKHFGAADFVVGIVFATYSLAQLIAGPLWGNLSDRIGRKAVLIVSQIGATIGWAMLGIAPNLAWVIGARAIEGLSGGNLGVTQAYVSDLVPPEKRGRAFAWLGAAFSLGFVFGPALSGWLASRYGFSMPFLVAAGLQALTLVLTIFLLPESRSGATDEAESFGDRRVGPVLWLRLVFTCGMYGWFGVMALVLNHQLGWGVGQISAVFTIFGLFQVALGVFAVGRSVERSGNRAATNRGFVLLIGAFVLVPFATNLPVATAMLVLFGLGMSLENTAFPGLASEVAPDDRRGTVLGVVSGRDSFAGIDMPPLTTGVLGLAGVVPADAIVVGLITAALAIGLVQARGMRLPTPAPAD
jgi:DHA1 family tetracycline resistance protein-like MFS transporter